MQGETMKTAELIGENLNYWVARANGWVQAKGGGLWCHRLDADGACRDSADVVAEQQTSSGQGWNPSEVWDQGGPIIERERIELVTNIEGEWTAEVDPYNYRHDPGKAPTATGTGPLVAAMRAYVASKFGEEVP